MDHLRRGAFLSDSVLSFLPACIWTAAPHLWWPFDSPDRWRSPWRVLGERDECAQLVQWSSAVFRFWPLSTLELCNEFETRVLKFLCCRKWQETVMFGDQTANANIFKINLSRVQNVLQMHFFFFSFRRLQATMRHYYQLCLTRGFTCHVLEFGGNLCERDVEFFGWRHLTSILGEISNSATKIRVHPGKTFSQTVGSYRLQFLSPNTNTTTAKYRSTNFLIQSFSPVEILQNGGGELRVVTFDIFEVDGQGVAFWTHQLSCVSQVLELPIRLEPENMKAKQWTLESFNRGSSPVKLSHKIPPTRVRLAST